MKFIHKEMEYTMLLGDVQQVRVTMFRKRELVYTQWSHTKVGWALASPGPCWGLSLPQSPGQGNRRGQAILLTSLCGWVGGGTGAGRESWLVLPGLSPATQQNSLCFVFFFLPGPRQRKPPHPCSEPHTS